jgi:hypothetical protein
MPRRGTMRRCRWLLGPAAMTSVRGRPAFCSPYRLHDVRTCCPRSPDTDPRTSASGTTAFPPSQQAVSTRTCPDT